MPQFFGFVNPEPPRVRLGLKIHVSRAKPAALPTHGCPLLSQFVARHSRRSVRRVASANDARVIRRAFDGNAQNPLHAIERERADTKTQPSQWPKSGVPGFVVGARAELAAGLATARMGAAGRATAGQRAVRERSASRHGRGAFGHGAPPQRRSERHAPPVAQAGAAYAGCTAEVAAGAAELAVARGLSCNV